MLDGVMLLWFVLTAAVAAVRGGGHSHDAGISSAQMGIRAADRVSPAWSVRFSTCSAAVSRCRGCTSATSPRAGGRRWDRPCIAWLATASASWPARCSSSAFGISGLAEVAARIHSGLCLRLDDFPGAVHARHGRRLVPTRARQHLRVGAAVDESADGGNGADRDDAARTSRPRPTQRRRASGS